MKTGELKDSMNTIANWSATILSAIICWIALALTLGWLANRVIAVVEWVMNPKRGKAMRKVIAWSAAWALYWLGDLVSRPLNRFDYMAWLYPIYNRLMCTSSSVQDWAGLSGPWRPVEIKATKKRGGQ